MINSYLDLVAAPQPEAAEIQPSIHAATIEKNSVAAGLNVHSLFMDHYVDPVTGMHGARGLIAKILLNKQITLKSGKVHTGAVLPAYDASNPKCKRIWYLRLGMTTAEIIEAFRAEMPDGGKYPDSSIEDILTRDMVRDGQIGSITMDQSEDPYNVRNSEKLQSWRIANGKHPIARNPRNKWFLLMAEKAE